MIAKRAKSVLRDKLQHLECYVLQQHKIQEALKEILAATANRRGEKFFRTLVTQMARVLEVRYVYVAELLNQETARTLAMWNGDAIGTNMTYALAGTPCSEVIARGFSIHPDNGQQNFPEDYRLLELGAVSYAGTTLLDTHGKPIGILAILDDKPLAQADFAEYLLSVFAIQAASELFSMRAEKALRLEQGGMGNLLQCH